MYSIACTCVYCSLRPQSGNYRQRYSWPRWWVESWRRFKQAPWTTNILLVAGSMTLAALVLYTAPLAGWVGASLPQQNQPNLPSSSSGLDLPPTSALRAVPPVEQRELAGGLLPAAELEQYRQHLLALINADREANDLYPVVLGNNSAAQGHAEDMLRQGYVSHWDPRGLTPYMRYTLAENSVWAYREKSTAASLKEAQEWLMNSPGHRKNILDKWRNQVNLGIACNESACAAVQQFESDYVVFRVRPTISNGILRFAGNLKGDFTFQGVHLWYDQPPLPLTPGYTACKGLIHAGPNEKHNPAAAYLPHALERRCCCPALRDINH